MKAFIGYIPILIVVVPCVVTGIRQALYYSGCMDGFGYVLVAMFAFIGGGVLNAIFLFASLIGRRAYLRGLEGGRRVAAEGAVYLSMIMFIAQIALVICGSL